MGVKKAGAKWAAAGVAQPLCDRSDRLLAPLHQRLLAALPFELTAAQHRVCAEIIGDLRRPAPMHRLLQGDVGSGKTVVAALAAVVCIEAGWQCALMAPTEILATQHFAKLVSWLQPLGITTVVHGLAYASVTLWLWLAAWRDAKREPDFVLGRFVRTNGSAMVDVLRDWVPLGLISRYR